MARKKRARGEKPVRCFYVTVTGEATVYATIEVVAKTFEEARRKAVQTDPREVTWLDDNGLASPTPHTITDFYEA